MLELSPSESEPLTSLSSPRMSLEKRLHSRSMSSTLISLQGVVLQAAMLDSTNVIISHSSFNRPTSRLWEDANKMNKSKKQMQSL